LRCPRAHFRYIEEYGVHDFITSCKKVIDLSEKQEGKDKTREEQLDRIKMRMYKAEKNYKNRSPLGTVFED
jgi:hypothetical protein